MPIVTTTILKGYFNNGDVPIESNYIDLIDTLNNAYALLTEPMVDYSAISVVTGFSASLLLKSIFYKKVGGLVFVQWDISGTSNSNVCNFSLPYVSDKYSSVVCRVINNGTNNASEGYLDEEGATFNFKPTIGGAINGWTTTGVKRTVGTHWYYTA